MRNRNSKLLKSSIKLVVDVILVKEIGGEEGFNLLLLLYYITKSSSFKQHKFIILHFWRSEVPNQSRWVKIKLSAGSGSFKRLKGRIYLPFPRFKGYHNLWLMVLFHLHLFHFCFDRHISFSDSELPAL